MSQQITKSSPGRGEPRGAVMVWGGGIAGMQASLDLSTAGFRVYLVEESPTIGGGMGRLDKTFPTGDCATCIISPKLVACMRDMNIDVLTMADVLEVDGEAGDFKVKVRLNPRGVNMDKCTGCGDCTEHCPVRSVPQTPDPFRPSDDLPYIESPGLDTILFRHRGDPGRLMPILHDLSSKYGYLPRLALEHVSARLGIPMAEILRVASFYQEFEIEPQGRHVIEVCSGTSCYSRGSGALQRRLEDEIGVSVGETDETGRFTLKTVRCLGLCALSPAMKIDGISFGRVDPGRVPSILEQFQ